MSKILYDVSGRIAVITIDNPPVNSLGLEVRTGIVNGLDTALADSNVDAIVLIGSERAFSGGADIREFSSPNGAAEPHLLTVIELVEAATKPFIVAIGGVCMGGGLELALAAHFRVAKRGTSIALPEVKLGLLPGAGGTQRLPRLLGVERATGFIVSGDAVAVEAFEDSALFDAIVDGDLRVAALAFAEKVVAESRPLKRVRDVRIDYPYHEAYFQFARNMVRGAAGKFPAPLKCIDAIQAAVTRPFAEGLREEHRLFAELLQSSESRALRHTFFGVRAASKISGVDERTSIRPIARVGVVGAGTMGGGIAMSFLNAGIPVTLIDTNAAGLHKGIAKIASNYDGTVSKGKLSPAARDARMALLKATLEFDALTECDLIIEAVFEDIGVKEAVFVALDGIAKSGAILATNTSTLDVDRIARFTKRPRDVVGMHFFSPANVMKLLEVVRGAETAPDVLLTVMQLAKKIGKTAVVAGVCDGFIGNRMLDKYMQAAHSLVVSGATPWQVDTALEKWGMAMGPFRMSDLAGNDIGWAIRKRRRAEKPPVANDVGDVADRLCEQGRFGQKVGKGWYVYPSGSRTALPDPEVEALIGQFREAARVVPRKIAAEEIVERCILALTNEGARVVDEGIAARASDIDVVYLFGYGFPAHRGGPMRYADEIGLYRAARKMQSFAASGDAFWQPAALINRRLAEGATLT